MAGYFFQLKPLFKKIQEDLFNKSVGFIRNASRESSEGIGRSHGRRSKYGFKRTHLSVVRSGEVLYDQRSLQYSPGLNVGLGSFARLYAKCPGTVLVTCEKTNYDPNDPLIQYSFPMYVPTYARYINVIPEPLHRRFKLIEKF